MGWMVLAERNVGARTSPLLIAGFGAAFVEAANTSRESCRINDHIACEFG